MIKFSVKISSVLYILAQALDRLSSSNTESCSVFLVVFLVLYFSGEIIFNCYETYAETVFHSYKFPSS